MVDIASKSKSLLMAFSVLLMFFSSAGAAASAQQSLSLTAQESALPSAPEPQQPASQSATEPLQSGTGSISGTVMDPKGDVLQGAQVTLAGPSHSDLRHVVSASDGQFAFTGLAPGSYKVTVTGPGMSTFTSTQIPLHASEARVMPPVTLTVSGGTTSVTVTGNKEELAEEQVHIAVQQRIGGVIPNFYSTYDWNAPPMQAKQKFQLSIRVDHRSGLVLDCGRELQEPSNTIMSSRTMAAELKDMESDTVLRWQITLQAPCWAELSILRSFIRTRVTSTRERAASARARCTQCLPQ